jgi:FkbM family methyltransferase
MNNTGLKGLFLNTAKANCSIHESGKMCYDCLILSDGYTLDYKEIDADNRDIALNYDFYVFNYHQITMGWLDTKILKQLPGFKATIVLEVLPNNPFVMCPKDHFDAYLVLDPTLSVMDHNVFPFPRPLENTSHKYVYQEKSVPVIGSFGFATIGKGFDLVINAVNREFEKAIVKINIPAGDYVSKETFDRLNNELKNVPTKEGVVVEITNHYFNKEQLIEWCAQNTLNLFLYNRNIPGLSATTDQAIVSGRPLAISTDNTFRHIHTYLTPYPFQSLKESIQNSPPIVSQIQKNWAPDAFSKRFEYVLSASNVSTIQKSETSFALPKIVEVIKPVRYVLRKSDFIPPVIYKLVRRLRKKNTAITPPNTNTSLKILTPFIHYALASYSQHNEDLLIDLLTGIKKKGFYVDIGANDPSFNSNTKKFYLRNWTGINVEPNVKAYQKLSQYRPNDINLNLAVSGNEGDFTFYQLSDDSTLSTLDLPTAKKMAEMLNLTIAEVKVKTQSLEKILDAHAGNNTIDFMSVDAEGHDLTVLKSNNWVKYRPGILIVESNNEFEDIRKYLDINDYMHIFSNYYNAIFIDKRTKDETLLSNINWNYN